MKKKYKSIKEIDRDLEILHLEKTIHYLKIKQSTKDLRSALTISSLLAGLVRSFLK